jgi:transposase
MTIKNNRAGDNAGSVVGIDPHKRTLSACVLDERGALLAIAHFRVSGDGHRALEAWALGFGSVRTWGIEGASGLGRHTAIFLTSRG